MKVNFNEKEYEALCFCYDQILNLVGAGSDEEYQKEANKHLDALVNLKAKYLVERNKYREFLYYRAYVAQQNKSRNLLASEINKITRRYIKALHG